MNFPTRPHDGPPDDRALLIEALLEENDRLARRVDDLVSNQEWYVALIKVAIDQLHRHHLRLAREHQAARERLGLDDYDDREWAA